MHSVDNLVICLLEVTWLAHLESFFEENTKKCELNASFPYTSIAVIVNTLVTVASSASSQLTSVAQSVLNALYYNLPVSLQEVLAQDSKSAGKSTSSLPTPLLALLSFVPVSVTPSLLLAFLTPALIVLFTMSTWRSYFGAPSRFSPFAPSTSRQPPIVTADDYHYIGPDDIVDPPQHSRLAPGTASYFPTGSRHGSRADADNPNAPDILLIKHKNATYPLQGEAATR